MHNYKTLEDMLSNGWDISISKEMKRVGDPGKHDPRWDVRHVYEISLEGTIFKSEWEGFHTAEECVADILHKANHGED